MLGSAWKPARTGLRNVAALGSSARATAATRPRIRVASNLIGRTRMLLAGRGLNDGFECRFRLKLAVEQQRVVVTSPDGPVVAPGVAVVYAPERHAVNFVGMLHKEAKELRVPIS